MSQIDTTSGAELWLRGMGLGHSIRQAEQQQDFDRQRFAWQQEEAARDNAFRQQVQDSSNAHWDSEMLRRLFGDAEHSRQFDLNYGLQSDVQQRLQQEFEDRQAAETSAGEAMRAQNRMMLGRFGGSSDPSMLVPDQPGSLGPGLKDIADLVERGHPKAQPVIAKILQSEVGSRRLAGALAEAKAGGVSPGALADPDLRDLVQHSLDINDPEAGFEVMKKMTFENLTGRRAEQRKELSKLRGVVALQRLRSGTSKQEKTIESDYADARDAGLTNQLPQNLTGRTQLSRDWQNNPDYLQAIDDVKQAEEDRDKAQRMVEKLDSSFGDEELAKKARRGYDDAQRRVTDARDRVRAYRAAAAAQMRGDVADSPAVPDLDAQEQKLLSTYEDLFGTPFDANDDAAVERMRKIERRLGGS